MELKCECIENGIEGLIEKSLKILLKEGKLNKF